MTLSQQLVTFAPSHSPTKGLNTFHSGLPAQMRDGCTANVLPVKIDLVQRAAAVVKMQIKCFHHYLEAIDEAYLRLGILLLCKLCQFCVIVK